jgi:WD40 repeat protein/tRNA A-37 threonylcarbamoyl transferase component Bud32
LTLAGWVDRACDHYEAEWKAGVRPRIEAHLADAPDSTQVALLRELLLLEIEFRRAAGEQPTAQEYQARFPQHDDLISSVFAFTVRRGDPAASYGPAEGANADRKVEAGAPAQDDQARIDLPADAQTDLWRARTKPSPDAASTTLATRVGTSTSSGTRFRILRLHDRGGLGEVYVARDDELNRDVALKAIRGRFADHPIHRARFEFEAEITGSLEHPAIVPVYGLGHYEDGRPFYAMRFIRGDSLNHAIERFHAAESPGRDAGERVLELRKLLARFLDVCDALEYAHSRGVLHRDLKPANIMLGKYGETLVVDWGLAKALDHPELSADSPEPLLQPKSGGGLAPTVPGTAVGTPAYMSPEQAAGRLDELGRASDVYGLGATLYHVLTGRAPVTDLSQADILGKVIAGDIPRPRAIQPRASPALEAICLKAIALVPEARYGSPRALAEDIEHWLADEPVSAYAEPWIGRFGRWARRHRPLVTGGAALLLTAVVALAIGTALVEKARRAEAVAHKNEGLARRQAEAQLYMSNIALAGREWLAGNVARAHELLNECAPDRREWEWHYLKRQGHSGMQTLVGPQFGVITAVAFSSVGQRLVSAGWDGTVKVWDTEIGRAILDLDGASGHQGHVLGAAYSPDGKLIATAGADKSVRLWNASTGEPGRVIVGHSAEVTAVTFSPDGRRLASAGRDNFVKVWSTTTGELAITLRGHAAAVTTVAFSPDGNRLATAGEYPDMAPRLWDADTGHEIRRFQGHLVNVNSLAFRPDGSRLASAGNDGVVLIWDVDTGKQTGMLSPDRRRMIEAVAYSADGKLLASGGLDQIVRIWDARTHRELRALHGHASGVTSLAFHPDGVRLASGSQDGVVKIWDATKGAESIRIAPEPKERYSGLAFSPDGRSVAAAVQGYTMGALAHGAKPQSKVVRLWNAVDGAGGPVLEGHDEDLADLAFDSAGRRLAAAGVNGTVTVWELPSGRRMAVLRSEAGLAGRPENGGRVCFGPDTERVAFAGPDGTVTVWETAGGSEVRRFRVSNPLRPGASEQLPLSLAFSPDGRHLAAGDLHAIRLWDVASGKELSILHGGLAAVLAIAFSPDGRQLAAALLREGGISSMSEIKICDVATGRESVTFSGAVGGTFALAFSQNGKRLASTGYYHRDVMLWDTSSGRELLAIRLDDQNNIGGPGSDSRLVFSPDSARLALVGQNGLSIWDAAPSPEMLTVRAPVSVWGLAYSPDGRRLATADNHEAVSIRDASTGRILITLPVPNASLDTSLIDVRFSPDGHRLAAAIATKTTGTVTVWDATTGRLEGRLDGHAGHIINVSFSPDGTVLATASHDKTVKLWDAKAFTAILTLTGFADRVNGVAFDPDGRSPATVCRDGTVKLWNAGDGRELCTLGTHKGSIVGVAFNADGRYLATAGGRRSDQADGPPGELKIWDVANRREMFNLPGLTHFLHAVAFSPDSRLLASAGEDRVVRLWDVATGRELANLRGHHDTIKRVAFSPDGRSLASCGEDRTVRAWDLSRVMSERSSAISGIR